MLLSKMKYAMALVLALVLAAVTATAQTRSIALTLQVTGPSGEAVTDASVTLMHTAYSLSYGAIALNAQGQATIKVYAGPHSLTVSKAGYNTVTQAFNVSADTTVAVQLTEVTQLPFALSATVQHDAHTGLNNVTLTWNQEQPVFFDDFESYPAFALQFGDWTGIDGDGLATAPLTGDYLNRGQMQYAQIMNPLKVTPSWWYDYPILRPYAGQQYVGFIRTASGQANDDWLISPAITPGTQNVLQFRARAADAYKEKFQVLVTEKVDNPTRGDFKLLSSGNYETVDYKAWYLQSYDLSAYAGKPIRFAIRYMSAAVDGGAFMLMVDNVYVGQAFNAPKAPARRVAARSPMNPNESFNLYLDGNQVGTTSDYEYTFANLPAGTHRLGVQAVYAASRTAIADTLITLDDRTARVTMLLTANNGMAIDSGAVQLADVASGQVYQADIVKGTATLASLPLATYLVGVALPNYETWSQQVAIGGDTTLSIGLIEAIVTPYNLTADVIPLAQLGHNQVTVRWNQNLSVRDSFEDYADFATGSFGGWRTWDLDQHNTYPIGLGSQSNIVNFPGASTPSSPKPVPPMVFNPWHTTPAMLPTDRAVQAPSGDKTVVFFSPQQNGANKWLVSPAVQVRDGFVNRFTAKAYGQYAESMEVCVFPATAANPTSDSYEVASTIAQVSYGQWTIYETDLSRWAGQTVRIGLHYTSYDAFFVQIDDFYVGNMQDDGSGTDVGHVLGYVVSLDGDSVTTVSANQVTLDVPDGGTHQVAVKANYASGQSAKATINFTLPLRADVDGNGKVNTADVTALATAILAGEAGDRYDLDLDGNVSATDVTALVSYLLN